MDELGNIRKRYDRRKEKAALYSFFDPSYLFLVQQKEKWMLQLLDRYRMAPLSDKKIIDIGCGNGTLLIDFIEYGASIDNLFGIDVLEEKVEEAKLYSQNLEIVQGN